MADAVFLPLATPPGSDVAIGTEPFQVIWGRTGNDTLLGYYRSAALPGNFQIDVFLVDSELAELVDPFPRDWNNTVTLGDWRGSFYANGDSSLYGLNDFALIADFDPSKDTIQLYGDASRYSILDLGFLTVISYLTPVSSVEGERDYPPFSDVIAILPLGSQTIPGGINLADPYFQYTGYNPPVQVSNNILQFGTAGADVSDAITVDNIGNIYAAGSTTESLSSVNLGFRDVWVRKYDTDGSLIFTKQFGSTGDDYIYAMTTDSEGYLYVVGKTTGDLSGPKLGINTDAWIAKFDSNGNQLWLNKISGTPAGQPASSFGINIDDSGFLYVSGVVDIPSPQGAQFALSTDNFVAKYDSNGNQVWIRQEGDPAVTSFDESYGSTVDGLGNTFRVGFTTGDFAGPIVGLYDAWVSKHNSNGELDWITPIASADYDWAWSVATTTQGDPIATGWTLGAIDPASSNFGSYDAYLTSIDSETGLVTWSKQFGTAGDDQAFTIKIDSDDNIYLAGFTNGSFSGFTNQGNFDAWVAKFDPSGNLLWVQQFGTPHRDEAYDLAIGPDDSISVVGITNGSLGALNAGTYDTWIAKLSSLDGSLLNFAPNHESSFTGIEGSKKKVGRNTTMPDSSPLQELQSLQYSSSPQVAVVGAIELLFGVDASLITPESINQYLESILQPYPAPPEYPDHPEFPEHDGEQLSKKGTKGVKMVDTVLSSDRSTVVPAEATWQNGVNLVRITPGDPASTPELVQTLGTTPISGFFDVERSSQKFSNEDFRMASALVDATAGLLEFIDLSSAREALQIEGKKTSLLTNNLRFVKVDIDPITGLQVAGVDAEDPGFLDAVRNSLLDFSFSQNPEGSRGSTTFTHPPSSGGLFAPVLIGGNDDIFTFTDSTTVDEILHLKMLGQNNFGFEYLLDSQ